MRGSSASSKMLEWRKRSGAGQAVRSRESVRGRAKSHSPSIHKMGREEGRRENEAENDIFSPIRNRMDRNGTEWIETDQNR